MKRKLGLTIAAGILGAAAWAQTPSVQNPDPQIPGAGNDPAAQTPRAGTAAGRYDDEIQGRLNRSYSDKDKFRRVEASVDNGIVTLQGTVDLYAHKEQAGEKASDTDHVQGVRNLIQVRGDVPDAELRETLAKKLRYDRVDRGLTFNSLNLNVRGGIVEVSGKVHDEVSKASALAIVKNTQGVKGVREEIDVAPVSLHDDDLRMALAQKIYGDAVLQKYGMDPQSPIRILVENGHVTLAGVVESEMDKNVAGIRAKEVGGVFSVDNQLVVAGRDSNAKKNHD